jgi:starch synthase
MIACRYGSVPIVRETGGLKDSIKDFGCEGGGNGYTFNQYNVHDFEYSVWRALNDYKNREGWKEKIKLCMSKDFSWTKTSKSYLELYKSLINKG